jgi:hypothetical protein
MKLVTTYYAGEKPIWRVESFDIPEKADILKTILFLSQNGYGDVTKYEVQL